MAERIVEKVCVTKYKGHCPVCGKEQVDRIESFVDKKCNKCIKEEKLAKLEKECSFLVGSTITGIIINEDCLLDGFILQSIDNKKYRVIKCDDIYYDEYYIKVEEVKDEE